MKRNLELIKNIMLQIENAPTYDRGIDIKNVDFTEDEIEYHIQLLEEARLIRVIGGSKMFGPQPTCLTGPGHDFLAAINNDTVWKKTTKFIKEKGGGFTLEIVKAIGTKFLESHLGLS